MFQAQAIFKILTFTTCFRIGGIQKCHSNRTKKLKLLSHACRITHVNVIVQILASQLHFLGNNNVELAAVLPILWPVNCIDVGGHAIFFYHSYLDGNDQARPTEPGE